MDLAAIAQTVAVAVSLTAMTPPEKAATVVVSGLPAPPGVGGVIIMGDDLELEWPSGPIVFTDQEGEGTKRFLDLPPHHSASWYRKTADAFQAGRATGRALRRVGVDVDLAPVLDSPDGPLGSRHFRRPALGLAFARGLAAGGVGACAKHFPGLGSAPISTDYRPHVDATVREDEVAAFRAAIDAGVPCVMTSNAFYDGRKLRASIERSTYRLLRSLGFEGVAITDSLSVVRKAPVERWAVQAVRAGADLVLFTSPEHARRAIVALVPLAKRGELDAHVARVLRWRMELAR